jgi:hypothetical protein
MISSECLHSSRLVLPPRQTRTASGAGLRIFDSGANTFELNQAGLIVAHTPTEGFGGKMVLIGGTDAKVLNSFYWAK